MTKSQTIWFTGLSGAGKTTLSTKVYNILRDKYNIECIDGDKFRKLWKTSLGFSKNDRDINVNCMGMIAHFLNKNGISVIIASISPYQEMREFNGELIKCTGSEYFHVHCDCDLETLKYRDTKGLYKKNNIKLTGVDDPYETPENADIVVNTALHSIDTCVQNILLELSRKKLIGLVI